MSFAELSDAELLLKMKSLRGNENQVLADLVAHLCEIDTRGIYRDAGYSSLFTYCVEGLGYSEGSAHRRVRAARCLAKSPEVYERIRDGKVTLCALAEVAPLMTEANTAAVLEKVEGATKKQAELLAVQLGAPEKPKRECIRAKKVAVPPVKSTFIEAEAVAEKYSLSFEVSKEVKELAEEAKELAGRCSMAEVFEKSLREFVAKRKAQKKYKGTSPVEGKGRYVPKVVRGEVRERDGGQCTFVSSDGRRCSERCGLEMDHVLPFAMGGKSSAENLRLLCAAHNRLSAERVFGKGYILKKMIAARA